MRRKSLFAEHNSVRSSTSFVLYTTFLILYLPLFLKQSFKTNVKNAFRVCQSVCRPVGRADASE